MSFWQFVAEIVTGLAWPAAICWVVYQLRHEIRQLLPHARLKYGGLDVSFRLDKAEEEARSLPVQLEQTDDEGSSDRALAERSPEYAIIEAWSSVEEALQSLARRADINTKRGSSALYLTRVLRKHGRIDATTSRMIDELRNVRNVVVHEPGTVQLSAGDAIRYRELARQIVVALTEAESVPLGTQFADSNQT